MLVENMGLSDLLRQFDESTDKKFSDKFQLKLLRELRKSKVTRPDIVLLFADRATSIEYSNEIWSIYEQIGAAALAYGDVTLAEKCLQRLSKKFPNSARVQKLKGMMLESQGNFKEALELYDQLLTKNASNIAVLKRRACVHKAKGDINSFVEELNKVLALHLGDVSSWLELSEIYALQGQLQDTIHCLEQVVLNDPENAVYHARLADAYYSVGDEKNITIARKHYSISLKLQGPQFNLRAVLGLLAASRALKVLWKQDNKAFVADKSGSSATNQQHAVLVNDALIKYAQDALSSLRPPSDHILVSIQKSVEAL